MHSNEPNAQAAASPGSEADIIALAACAGLALSDERIAAVCGVLSAWLPAANELSRKMSAAEHQDLMPIVAFAQVPDSAAESA